MQRKVVALKVVLPLLIILLAVAILGPTAYGRFLGPQTSFGRLSTVRLESKGTRWADAPEGHVWVLRFRSETSAIITGQVRDAVPLEKIQNGYLVPGEVFVNMSRETVDLIRERTQTIVILDGEGHEFHAVSATFGPTVDKTKDIVDTRMPELFFALPRGSRPRFIRSDDPDGSTSTRPIPLIMISLMDHLRVLREKV